jgi:hypothetical protein
MQPIIVDMKVKVSFPVKQYSGCFSSNRNTSKHEVTSSTRTVLGKIYKLSRCLPTQFVTTLLEYQKSYFTGAERQIV